MIGIKNGINRSIPLLVLITFLLSACAGSPSKSSEQAVPTIMPPPSFTPTPSPRTLTVCLGQEPNTLYPYGNLNAAAQSLLAAIDDGPVDRIGYTYKPAILQKLPSVVNGDATISQITVNNGSEVVDANGNLTALNIGTSVRPSGCRSSGCAINYSGSALQMDQMSVTFHLRPDLTWSDGTPLTADDLVYGYQIVSNDFIFSVQISCRSYAILFGHRYDNASMDGNSRLY